MAHRPIPMPGFRGTPPSGSTDGREVWLPADLCLRRPHGLQEIEPPFPLSTGSAAGKSWEAAALHGLLELIERDAASLWWRGGKAADDTAAARSPCRSQAKCCHDFAKALAAQQLAARHHHGYRRTLRRRAVMRGGWPRSGLRPCVAPDLEASSRSAILEMCQIELAYAVVEAKRRERGEAALNPRDRVHLRRATLIGAEDRLLLQPAAERPQRISLRYNRSG